MPSSALLTSDLLSITSLSTGFPLTPQKWEFGKMWTQAPYILLFPLSNTLPMHQALNTSFLPRLPENPLLLLPLSILTLPPPPTLTNHSLLFITHFTCSLALA